MSYDSYECLKVRLDRYVASVTIDHPPINLFDRALMLEFHYLGKQLAGDPDVKVAVFASANPDFFIAHADITSIAPIANANCASTGNTPATKSSASTVRDRLSSTCRTSSS